MKSLKLIVFLTFAVSLMASTVFGAGGPILPGKYTGGGWIESAEDADSRASFGFNLNAIDEDGDGIADTAKGNLLYHDDAAGVKVRCEVTSGGHIQEGEDTFGVLVGTYTPQPNSLGEGGTFEALVLDAGEGALSGGDSIEIHLIGGVHADYSNAGSLGGGNIQYHPAKE